MYLKCITFLLGMRSAAVYKFIFKTSAELKVRDCETTVIWKGFIIILIVYVCVYIYIYIYI